MYKKFFKRFFDFTLSFFALIVLLPIFLILSLLVFCNMGAPIFFKQKRVGKGEKIFTMYKFRTMSNKKDKDGKIGRAHV